MKAAWIKGKVLRAKTTHGLGLLGERIEVKCYQGEGFYTVRTIDRAAVVDLVAHEDDMVDPDVRIPAPRCQCGDVIP